MSLNQDAWKGIEQLAPGALDRRDARLEAVAGQPPVLIYWNPALGAKPTDDQITAAIAAYDAAQAQADAAAAAERDERTQLAALDSQLSAYLALSAPTAAQTGAIVRLLVRAVRYLVRHAS